MALQRFIDIFGGHLALTLCQNLAIAHSNALLEGSSITPYEASRFLVKNTIDPKQFVYDNNDWARLRSELKEKIRQYKSDTCFFRDFICGLLQDLRHVAAFFTPAINNKKQKSIFSCIVDTYRKATQAHVAHSDSDGISYGVTNPKWNRETLRSIARIGIALEKIANIIQGCLYANGIKETLYYYQNYCGVQLTTELNVNSLADAMDWTEKYAQACMRTIKPSNPGNLPLNTIPELREAILDGKIKEDGTICVKKPALIRYFLENSMFLPLEKESLNQIDGLLKTKDGKPISSSDLSKETSQLQKRGKILREDRDSGKTFTSKH